MIYCKFCLWFRFLVWRFRVPFDFEQLSNEENQLRSDTITPPLSVFVTPLTTTPAKLLGNKCTERSRGVYETAATLGSTQHFCEYCLTFTDERTQRQLQVTDIKLTVPRFTRTRYPPITLVKVKHFSVVLIFFSLYNLIYRPIYAVLVFRGESRVGRVVLCP